MDFDAKLLDERLKAIGAHLSPADLAAAGAHFRLRALAPGETLINEGDTVPAACLVMDGSVLVRARVADKDIDVVRLGPGSLVGEVSFIDAGPATATVVADSGATVATLAHPAWERLEREHPRAAMSLYHAFTSTVATRLRGATLHFEDLRDPGSPTPSPEATMDAFRALFGLGMS